MCVWGGGSRVCIHGWGGGGGLYRCMGVGGGCMHIVYKVVAFKQGRAMP